MDMYQKRKMRQEKKNSSKNNGVEKIQLNWYPGHMAKTKRLIRENLNLVDIVYEVIDARIPYSSKIKDIDELIKDKPRLLIMSKYDLCDKIETDKWIEYYNNKGYYVITVNLLEKSVSKKIIDKTSEILSKLVLKREEKGIINSKFRALVIGIPNVGKSTLINLLCSKKKVETGNKPGVTKNLNWINVNEKLDLLDTPGILWPKFDDKVVAYNLASMTAIKETVIDNIDISIYILNKLEELYPEVLLNKYNIKHVNNEDICETLDIIGKRYGCIIFKGEIDYDRVCNIIINDIKNSNIKGITFDRISNNN